ncbi:Clr5 domain-containing protein [Xylariales sp. PMI_506]|nr:Clr5 domain-containing protein [Xylariales sp. PMI_506]
MSQGSAMLRLHSEEEWQAMRPIIERLYLRECRPLSSIMRMVEISHQFKATVPMYKRRFRIWGLQKNRPQIARTRKPGKNDRAVGAPRYLSQDKVNESLHTLLDLLRPWIAHATVLWNATHRFHQKCPPRAPYIYNDFSYGVAAATSAFESGDAEKGGKLLRDAFVDLEQALAPQSRSRFTLNSILFALATLNQAKLFKASRILVNHAVGLVEAASAQPSIGSDSNSPHDASNNRNSARDSSSPVWQGHESHPFPQILKRLQILANELEGDDISMIQAFFLVQSTYHRVIGEITVLDMTNHAPRRDYWRVVMRSNKQPAPNMSPMSDWRARSQLIVYYLNRLVRYAESKIGPDDDINLAHLDEIVSIYSYTRHEGFKDAASRMLAKLEKKNRISSSNGTSPSALEHRWCNADLELAGYYKVTGDINKALDHLGQFILDKAGKDWRQIALDEYYKAAREGHCK